MIKVLDHGYVRLVDSMGDDKRIVDCARVSHDNDKQPPHLRDAKLILYLLKNHHTSPFEHVIFTFEVKAPLFVFRQWHRHRTWSYNEVSARYTELSEDVYVPRPELIGTQSKTNHQSRDIPNSEDRKDMEYWIGSACEKSYDEYLWLLDHSCPRELARGVLPLNIYSRMYATVDLHNLLHFIKLRNSEHSQYEIRVYAKALLELITPIVPITVSKWTELNE